MKASLVSLACLLCWIGHAGAEVINYWGRLSVSGTYVEGVGRFKFALVGEQGAAIWSSGEIPLNVSGGTYAVRLGDSAQAPPIPEAVLGAKTPPRLRIWFQREPSRWAIVGPDVPLTDERPPGAGLAGHQADAILAELREIHVLLAKNAPGGARPVAPEIATVSTAGAPSLGSAGAPLVLVEFTDFQCAYCIQFENDVFASLKQKYVDSGKLRIVSRNLPLPIHQFAEAAARTALCAAAQGKFWPIRDALFAAKGALAPDSVAQIIQAVGLDPAQLGQCSATAETAAAIREEMQVAKAAGIEATPTFVLGQPNGNQVTGLKIVGAQPLAGFEAEIDKQLPPEQKPPSR